MTGCPGVFAGGDMVPAERTVTVGVGHGKKAASEHRRLAARAGAGQTRPSTPPVELRPAAPVVLRRRARRRQQPELPPERADRRLRRGDSAGCPPQEATFEARRCLSCGNCCECDGCLGACPEDAVIKLGPGHRYRFDYDRCTGCGACFEQCPVHAIEMVPEAG